MTEDINGKYEVPFDSSLDHSAYARAVNLCRRFGGVTYAEACRLRDSGATPVCLNPTRRVRSKKTGYGNMIPCPFCREMHNSRGLHVHIRGFHPNDYATWSANPRRLKGTAQEASA